MASQLPYFEVNYDDPYYLGRIVQEIGANNLGVHNFLTGSLGDVGFDRLLTTFEIKYSFFSQVFKINPVFFARGTMVIHNYLIAFFALQVVASVFFSKKFANAQYSLIFFVILLIPAGYLWDNDILAMYDGWQLNTAMWYGSSVVRVIGLPILFLTLEVLIRKNWQGAMVTFIISSISLLSFSAVAITLSVLFVISTTVVFFMLFEYVRKKEKE